MDLPSTYVSEVMTAQQAQEAMEALQSVLHSLVGAAPLVARYGYGCQLHPDLHGAPMRVGTGGVERFVRDSVRQEIFVPGEADVHFELADNRLHVVFCHEGHIHLGGGDQQLVALFASSSAFRALFAAQRV
jgi:hypothetical protein